MVSTQRDRDDLRAKFSADGQWVATYAWGLAVLSAILAAVIAWALLGSQGNLPILPEPIPVTAPVAH